MIKKVEILDFIDIICFDKNSLNRRPTIAPAVKGRSSGCGSGFKRCYAGVLQVTSYGQHAGGRVERLLDAGAKTKYISRIIT